MIVVCLISFVSLCADEIINEDFGDWVFYDGREGIFMDIEEVRWLLTLLSDYEKDAQEKDMYFNLWNDAADIAAEKEGKIRRLKGAIIGLGLVTTITATALIVVTVSN